MSRCFPFPPPGYEKKTRKDDVGLLKKEDREKKNKKEKKDKERRENKEKRERDRSDGKHRDKKEKKEKHKAKKEKDKEKSSASDEKRLPVQAKLRNGGDKASDERKLPGQPKHINGDKALDGRKLPEKSEGNGGEITTQKGKEKNVEKCSVSGEKKFAGQFSGFNGQKLIQNNSNLSHRPKDSNFVQELGKRARDQERNQFFEKFPGTCTKGDEGKVRLVAKAPGNLVGGKEKNKRDDDGKLDGQGIRDEARFTGSAQSLSATFQARTDGMARPLEKEIEKKMEGKDKTKQKESNDKREYKEKKGKEKDKVRDKQKKKEEKAKEKSEHKKKEPDKVKESISSDVVANNIVKASYLPKEITNSAVDEVNIKKRKDSDTNGFLHANDIKPNKLPRPASSLPLSAENGRMLATCQNRTEATRGKQEAVYSDKVDNKGHKKNGLIEAQAPSISTTQPLSISLVKPLHSTAQTDQIADVSRKQPHPDSKYLPEVLTVPKMEVGSDFEDQEWLFQSTNSQAKNPKVGFSRVDDTPLVWSEALQIESADVYALPYVIPY